jgi:hypothetical protein
MEVVTEGGDKGWKGKQGGGWEGFIFIVSTATWEPRRQEGGGDD